jgi:hypothetical protein
MAEGSWIFETLDQDGELSQTESSLRELSEMATFTATHPATDAHCTVLSSGGITSV